MQIKVTKAGRYMNFDLRAQDCKPGDLLETQEWYAQQMMANGNGATPSGAEADAAIKEAAKMAAAAKKAEREAEKKARREAAKHAAEQAEAAKAGQPANPFLG
ncbi:MAG: hypothetical protein WC837_04395 [Bellilinea sp.]